MAEIGYLDMEIFEHTFDILQNYLPIADCQQIFDELKQDLPLVNSPALKVIHQTSLSCTKCPDVNQDAILPQWNIVDPDLVLVAPSNNFTEEGKRILIESLKLAGFASNRCALTYSARCSKAGKYSDENVINCSSYLIGELSHWKPKLVIFMGAMSLVSISTEFKKEKISDIAGEINWMGILPYMIIESPNSVSYNSNESNYHNYFQVAHDFCYGSDI
jgi:hypothetical protein